MKKIRQRCGLSLKDMSLFSHIGRLREAGVRSIKIEGRMKRPEYVAAAVTAGRAALAGEKPDLDTLRAFFPAPALLMDTLPANWVATCSASGRKKM